MKTYVRALLTEEVAEDGLEQRVVQGIRAITGVEHVVIETGEVSPKAFKMERLRGYQEGLEEAARAAPVGDTCLEGASVMLPPYGSVRNCPKCEASRVTGPGILSKGFAVMYHTAGVDVVGRDEDLPLVEHMRVVCNRCGYQWYEATADA